MTKTLRILILEDRPADAELIQFELQEAGFDFVAKVATTKGDFLYKLKESPPDLILSDYDLPQYSGALALAEAKRRCPDVPFILVTGAISEDRAIETLTSGAKDYVMKSRMNRLVPAVKRALAEAEELSARKKAEEALLKAHTNLEARIKKRTEKLRAGIAERKRAERRQFLSAEVLGIINESSAFSDTIGTILAAIKRETGFDAVGIRLRSGDDFPYFVQNGFSSDFLLAENKLTVRDQDGGICRDEEGRFNLECTCGLVIAGRADPANPLFTQGGSFWINDSLPLLELPADQDSRLNPRNRCIHDGFRSVALIPIRAKQEIVGLLQLNDRKKGCFTLEMIAFFEGLGSSIGIALTRQRAEEAIKKRTLQLEAANRELEDFSYSISHDLRAPLRAIDGYTRMLLKTHGVKFDDDAKSKFHVIRDNVHKMERLIDDLLALARVGRQALSLSLLDMEELVKEIWQEQVTISPDRRMELKHGSLPQAFGDRTLIRQVLYNLLSNAVKFTKYKHAVLIEVGGKSEETENVYYVKDNGSGFDMKYCDKLFGVFQRLHNDDEYEGTGVGLAIVKQGINRHGGRVWGEGKENEGATFYFTLPQNQNSLIS